MLEYTNDKVVSAFTETGNKSIKNNAEIAKKVNDFFICSMILKLIFQIRLQNYCFFTIYTDTFLADITLFTYFMLFFTQGLDNDFGLGVFLAELGRRTAFALFEETVEIGEGIKPGFET